MKRSKEGVGKRRRAREIAVQMLYQQELGGSTLEQIFAAFDLEDYVHETDVATGEPSDASPAAGSPAAATRSELTDSFTYARELVEGATRNGEAIDELIREHAENWRLERMPVIDRSILRLAVYEMLHQTAVPKVVIVDEAIELAKKFGSEHSGRFVNGLLDGILKSRAVAVSSHPGAESLGAGATGNSSAQEPT